VTKPRVLPTNCSIFITLLSYKDFL